MQASILEIIDITITKSHVTKEINNMQNKIYQYFSETHGQVKDKEINEIEN